jgi:hypothetical protein
VSLMVRRGDVAECRVRVGVALRVHRAGKPRGGVVAAAGQRDSELLLDGVADDVVGLTVDGDIHINVVAEFLAAAFEDHDHRS